MLLENKVAIITGGTRGIGYAIVEKFIEEGAKVIFCGSREETVAKASEQLGQKYSQDSFKGIWPDLLNYNELKESFDQVIQEFGHVDILINNAGVSANEPFSSYTPEMFQRVMDLNVNAVFNCSRAIYDHFAERKSGVILNTSSMVSRDAQPSGIAYPTSKFALNGFTLALARELAQFNVRVNAIAPGITNTDMVANLPEEMIQPLINQIPLRRLGEPEDIANAFAFLASEKASYISGQILYIDGLMRV